MSRREKVTKSVSSFGSGRINTVMPLVLREKGHNVQSAVQFGVLSFRRHNACGRKQVASSMAAEYTSLPMLPNVECLECKLDYCNKCSCCQFLHAPVTCFCHSAITLKSRQ